MLPSNQTCKNCGNQFTGKYCNLCGEKVYTDHDKFIFHIADETVHFITHFDGSLLTTLKTIFLRPGKLALDYCNGIRKKYFKPISFFLLCIVLYLLFPKFDGLNMKFNSLLSPRNNFTWLSKPVARAKIHSSAITVEHLNETYNKQSAKVSKVFLLVLIPLTALLLYILFYTKHRYYFDHFIMATEFASVMIIIIFLLLPLILVLGSLIYAPFAEYFVEGNIALVISINLILLTFVSSAFRRFYQQKWWLTITKAVVFLFAFTFGVMYLYQCLLYLFVMLLV